LASSKSSWTGSKKNLDYTTDQKRLLIESDNSSISISRQCDLIGLSRTGYYYDPRPESSENLRLMRLIDEKYTTHPFLGVEKVTHWLRSEKGCPVNPKRVRRLMRLMGLMAVYPKPRLSLPGEGHRIYPYLLTNIRVIRPNQVWSTDITYIRLSAGFIYLVAVIDWFSRLILSWEVSTSLESDFCISALERALDHGKPEIFNTDQGSQFTSLAFTSILKEHQVAISMDGRGRALDNVFIERFWRSVKYEEVYLNDYQTIPQAISRLKRYFRYYNSERPHQSLDYQTPEAVHRMGSGIAFAT
jgi:putative transposase